MVDEMSKRSLALAWIGIAAAVYVAVLPMADTIALRNTALLLLLLLVAQYLWHERFELVRLAGWPVGVAFVVWSGYLLVFPFAISRDMGVALQSLGGQWGPGVLAVVAGAGAGLATRRQPQHLIFWLGVISCIPNLIHIVLFVQDVIQSGQVRLNFWGREAHHADLGYAAGQSVILLTVALLTDGKARVRWVAGALIVACISSTVIASSRGGQVFSLLGMGLAAWAVLRSSGMAFIRKHGVFILLVVVLGGLALAFFVRHDGRWSHVGMYAKGAEGDALQIACKGMDYIKGEMGVQDDNVAIHILKGDGSRLVVLRGALELSKNAPWGVDGSRQAYQKLLNEVCQDPAYAMAHAHNGWLDTALAIGWLGAALYCWVLLAFAWAGYRAQRTIADANPWAHVLFAVAVFWILRGLTDSVFRDHMLEMQGFILSLAYVQIRLGLNGQNDR